MNEYDKRQIHKMKEIIQAYLDSKISLQVLIGELTFLRDNIENIDDYWEHQFTRFLIDLESVYSYVIDNKERTEEEHVKNIINDALNGIKNLIFLLHCPVRTDGRVDHGESR